MGRPRAIEQGDGSSGVRVEFLKTRQVLRFSVASEQPARGMELTLPQFCQQLGIDPSNFNPPRVYLLFAGRRAWAAGGTRDLVGTWDSEEEARAAFRRCREQRSCHWAELVSIEPGHGYQRLGWFGLDRPIKGRNLHSVQDMTTTSGRSRGIRRLLRTSRPSTEEIEQGDQTDAVPG